MVSQASTLIVLSLSAKHATCETLSICSHQAHEALSVTYVDFRAILQGLPSHSKNWKLFLTKQNRRVQSPGTRIAPSVKCNQSETNGDRRARRALCDNLTNLTQSSNRAHPSTCLPSFLVAKVGTREPNARCTRTSEHKVFQSSFCSPDISYILHESPSPTA